MSADRSDFLAGLVTGALLGGVVGGMLGAVVTQQISGKSNRSRKTRRRATSNGNGRHRLSAAKDSQEFLDEVRQDADRAISEARQSLEDKIAQLNMAIEDTRASLSIDEPQHEASPITSDPT